MQAYAFPYTHVPFQVQNHSIKSPYLYNQVIYIYNIYNIMSSKSHKLYSQGLGGCVLERVLPFSYRGCL